jgi:hypothetical protein
LRPVNLFVEPGPRSPRRFLYRYPVAVRLPLRFDAEPLETEVNGLPSPWWHAHLGPYHNGGWELISLWAPGGDYSNQTSRGAAFTATAALNQSPELQRVIESIPGAKNRVRLMRLRAGGEIHRHSDPLSELDPSLVRLHVPISTNPDVDFRVAGRRLIMEPGSVWHVDVRFPHEVQNRGATPRVHLVLDVYRSAELDRLLCDAKAVGSGRLTFYFAKHLLPNRVRQRLGWAN